VTAIRHGLPYRALEEFAASSGLPIPEISSLLTIPERTLARRKAAGKLSFDESERLLRLARIFEKAAGLFGGSSVEATQWLRLPKKALGGETPLDYSATELGAREVENLIGRIEYGVFS
jgi:putative toxin-antitoxin system antitoxin component (TIGR02293 family)